MLQNLIPLGPVTRLVNNNQVNQSEIAKQKNLQKLSCLAAAGITVGHQFSTN